MEHKGEHSIYKSFKETLRELYPKTAHQAGTFTIKPQLISPRVQPLPDDVFTQVEEFREAFYQVVNLHDYQSSVLKDTPWETCTFTPSAMTCLDFHYSSENGLKLIEVNTNASLFLPFQILKQAHGLKSSNPLCRPELLMRDFEKTAETVFGKAPGKIVILDEDPENEGLYFEFLLFKEFFQKNGYASEVHSLDRYNAESFDQPLVYNRTTDFYFEKPESQKLKAQYLSGEVALTPHPLGYALMADKTRLKDLRNLMEPTHPKLAAMIPDSKRFSDYESREEIWKKRKHLFFKPQNAFGGKGAFRGKSVSKTMFESLRTEDYMTQELCPPGKSTWTQGDSELEMKFDLRFYVCSEGLIDAGARLYQGQTTNMGTDFGGIAPVSTL